MKKGVSLLFLPLFVLSSCSTSGDSFTKSDKIKVMIERGANYVVKEGIKEINPGDDCTFHVSFIEGASLISVSYSDYFINNETDSSFDLTLLKVKYPLTVSLEMSVDSFHYVIEDSKPEVLRPIYHYHLRENTMDGYPYFNEEGYLPVGWNTKADYSGTYIPFGSRAPYGETTFYLQKEKVSDYSLFTYTKETQGLFLTSYTGREEKVVVPASMDGVDVYGIKKGTFSNPSIKEAVLGKNIKVIEDDAFTGTSLETLYCCDNIERVTSASFPSTLKTVYFNAEEKPRFSGSYYDTFPDKIDYLAKDINKEHKLVLFSGSSTRFGYYSPLLEEAYPSYQVINMGVFAYVNIKPQLEVISAFLKKGDSLLSSPEFDPNSLDFQMGSDPHFEWNLFAFFESNYDLLKYVDIRNYPDFFSSFYSYNLMRRSMPTKGYDVLAKHYDDDDHYHGEETYNIEGDVILDRPGNETDSWIMQPLADYTQNSITPLRVAALNQEYQKLLDKGIEVYFTFSPKNRNCLTKNSTEEERDKTETYLKEKLIIPVISPWKESILPGTDFYLIDNHLSSLAAKERTKRVSRDLYPFIKKA